MIFTLALLAAFGCALCGGVATVLQKNSADKATKVSSLHVGLFFRLLRNWPYLLAIVLDLSAYVLQVMALRSLPLFVVQPIVASSIVIVAVIERVLLRRKLRRQTVIAIVFMAIGLLLLTLTATPETAAPVGDTVRVVIIVMPLLLAVVGAIFAKLQTHVATIVLATVSGLAFGGTAIVGRMLRFSTPYWQDWQVFLSPLFASLLAYGLIGILLFTIALQRHQASVVNAVMMTVETIVPVGVGLLLLGDSPRHGLWLVMIVGAGVALTGAVLVAAKGTAEP
jgi:drug/metabolite transporter (DMT)-like permease